MNGCLKGLTRLGCLALVVLGAAALWWYREPIMRVGARWFGPRVEALPPTSDIAVGAPTPAAVSSGRSKLRRLAGGEADSVVLTPNEMASLIGAGVDWNVRRTFDSLRVELLDGTVAVHARLDTRQIPPEALGPLAGMLAPREALRMAGPLVIERPGTARWRIDELSVRGFAFPAPVVAQLAHRVAGADGSGAVPIQVDRVIGDVSVRPTGVTLYRRKRT